MWICEKRKQVYFRVPKCGTTTYLKVVGSFRGMNVFPKGVERDRPVHGDDHRTYLESLALKKWEDVKDWEKILLIRNPCDWAVSVHNMCARAGSHWKQFFGSGVKHNSLQNEDWVLGLKMTPMDWGTDADGKLAVDTVLCIENIDTKGVIKNTTNYQIERLNQDEPIMNAIKTKFHRELEYYK